MLWHIKVLATAACFTPLKCCLNLAQLIDSCKEFISLRTDCVLHVSLCGYSAVLVAMLK